jgi:hypothetical protein
VFVTTKHKTSFKEYSDAVQSLFSGDGEQLGDALLRAHNAHVKMLNESGFPARESAKSLLIIIKKF